jgi:hypothetical protein
LGFFCTKSRHEPTRSSRVFSHAFSCFTNFLAASRSSLYSALARSSSSPIWRRREVGVVAALSDNDSTDKQLYSDIHQPINT